MFFVGHREAGLAVFPDLLKAVVQHIEEFGVTEFVVGKYGGFDHLAAKAVAQAKIQYPQVTLTLLLPYHPAERPVEIPVGFDGTYYPDNMEKVPHRFAIARANRYIIDHVDYLIAYAWHPASNARALEDYAKRREKRGLIQVTTLYPQTMPSRVDKTP